MPAGLLRKPLPKPSPVSDPRYRRVMEQLKTAAKRTSTHPPAAKKTRDAAAAAKGPPNERIAGGKAKQVEKIRDAKEAKPEPTSFLAVLRAEVAKAMPANLGETEHFDEAAAKMKGGLKGNVAEQKEQSTQDISGAAKASPAPSGDAKVETPLPNEGATASPLVPGAQAMPAPKSDADVSLQDSKQNVDQQLKEGEVTTPQLQKANDPRFSSVLASKDEVVKNADSGPAKYRAAEGATLSSAAAGANGASRVGAAAMLGVHSGSSAKVLSRQQQQKARDEARRKEVVAQIEAIYETTKGRVETKLNDLDTEVNGIFDRSVDEALESMTSFVNTKIGRYKLERYLMIPILGLAAWVRDQFLDLPEEVNAFYEEGRQHFQTQMDRLIVRVSNLVEQRLKEAKAEVAKGQERIRIYVGGLPKDLQQIGQQAQTDVGARFEELRRGIDDKQGQLAQSLAQKYKDAFDKSNEALKAIQEANRGLVGKFAEKLGEVLKALREFKARVGAILRKSEETIKLIISDPIGFLGHLIDAVGGGIGAFADNITTHLKAGFMQWLFGNLPPGVELPTDFSLTSIFKLVLGVLGITYDRMRGKAVKLLGERNVKIIEKVADYIRTLITGGVAGLWEQVKGDLSNLKEMVIDAMQEWLITTLIKRAIAKVVLLFNPVGAIVQAIMAIYDIVMFIVEKAAQILAFVESVVNSVADIAAGSISSATKKIEDSLAKAIPLLIGFLARLLGISGLAEKIREFILKIQDRVDKAIDKVIAKAVAMVKKLLGKGGRDPGDAAADLRIRVPFEMKGEAHTLTAEPRNGGFAILMASSSGDLADKLKTCRDSLHLEREHYSDSELKLIRRGLDSLITEANRINKALEAAKPEERSKHETDLGALAEHVHRFGIRWGLHDLAFDGTYGDVEEFLNKVVPAEARNEVTAAINSAADKNKAASEIREYTKLTPELATKTFAAAELKLKGSQIIITLSSYSMIEAAKLAIEAKGLVAAGSERDVEAFIKKHRQILTRSLYRGPHKHMYDRQAGSEADRKANEGSFYQSHAEKQALLLALDDLDARRKAAEQEGKEPPLDDILTIGVSRHQCPEDCFPFFSAIAAWKKVRIVLVQPGSALLFSGTDGQWIFRVKLTK